jgi:hypothetical protein
MITAISDLCVYSLQDVSKTQSTSENVSELFSPAAIAMTAEA